jgi:hypothetical protein
MVNQAQAQASIPTTADNQQVVTVTLSSSSEAQESDPTKPEITELDKADGGGEHKDSATVSFCGVPSVTSVRVLVEMFNEYAFSCEGYHPTHRLYHPLTRPSTAPRHPPPLHSLFPTLFI